jgi:hypothetical protein
MNDYRLDAESKLPVRCSTCTHGHFEGPRLMPGDQVLFAVRCDHLSTLRPVDAEPGRPSCWEAFIQKETITDGDRTVPVYRSSISPQGDGERRDPAHLDRSPAISEPWNNPISPRQRTRMKENRP